MTGRHTRTRKSHCEHCVRMKENKEKYIQMMEQFMQERKS